MEPKMFAHYEALALDRARLPKQAEQGWLIDQAVASQLGPMDLSPTRRRLGSLIVAIGQRVQGLPDVTRPMTDPEHAH